MRNAVTKAFFRRHPVSLNELLLAPLVFRETLPLLHDVPFVGQSVLRDLAAFGGHRDGAVRTAMSRLRASGDIEVAPGTEEVRYRLGTLGRSVSLAVTSPPERPEGYLLAIFSFGAGDVRERQRVRTALKAHGFQKLAQNVYIVGQRDTAELERVFRAQGVSEHVYFFRCSGEPDPHRDRRFDALFDVKRRAALLRRFEADLEQLLHEPGLDGDDFARRYLAAAPVHYRITFRDEPPLPASRLPADYPLERLVPYTRELTPARARALHRYFDDARERASRARPARPRARRKQS